MNTSTIEDAREVRDLAKSRLASIPGVRVVGVGITKRDGGYAVKVNLERPAPSGSVDPALKIRGVPIVTEVVGTISIG